MMERVRKIVGASPTKPARLQSMQLRLEELERRDCPTVYGVKEQLARAAMPREFKVAEGRVAVPVDPSAGGVKKAAPADVATRVAAPAEARLQEVAAIDAAFLAAPVTGAAPIVEAVAVKDAEAAVAATKLLAAEKEAVLADTAKAAAAGKQADDVDKGGDFKKAAEAEKAADAAKAAKAAELVTASNADKADAATAAELAKNAAEAAKAANAAKAAKAAGLARAATTDKQAVQGAKKDQGAAKKAAVSASTAAKQASDTPDAKRAIVVASGFDKRIDGEMQEESARLRALQVQEQLRIQAISLANQSNQDVLALFR